MLQQSTWPDVAAAAAASGASYMMQGCLRMPPARSNETHAP